MRKTALNRRFPKKKLSFQMLLTFFGVAGLGLSLLAFAYFKVGFLRADETKKTFAPAALSFSEPELVNGLRGLYKWRGVETAPQPEPADDEYDRYEWKDLESLPGVYNFSAIDADIARAASEQRKYSFRVRAMRGYGDGVKYVPAYLAAYGWMADTDGNGSGDTFIPDWNNPQYLERAQKLVQALAAKYDGDKRVGWIEMGLYGQYGEWSISSSVNYAKAPSGIVPATQQTKNKITDYYVDSFRSTQLSTSFFTAGNEFQSLLYAFKHPRASKPIGWRTDCLGRKDYFDRWINNPDMFDMVKDQWKVAPVVAEFCKVYAGNTRDNFANALTQIATYHVSAVGNGNTDAWSKFSSTEQQQFIDVGKKSGYRIELKSLTLPSLLNPGMTMPIQSQWRNVGVAPIYENWDVYYRITDKITNAVIWETKSSAVKLKGILPSTTNSSFDDTVILPTTISAGMYNMSVIVKDPSGFRKPLQLAITGKMGDGGYRLGEIQIAVPSASPTPTPAVSPSPSPVASASPTVSPKPSPSPSPKASPSPSPTTSGDTVAPEITITAPSAGAVVKSDSTVRISGRTVDNKKVTKVEIIADGKTLCTKSGSSSGWACNWKIPKNTTGTKTITVVAFDSSNNKAEKSVTVQVQ